MTIYLQHGSDVMIRSEDSLSVSKTIPVNTYIIQKNQMTNELYLQTTNAMRFDGKIYGSVEKRVDRIMNTFADRDSSMGVLLSGEKGSGKSTLMRLVVQEGINTGIPSIIINEALDPTELTKFFAKIQDNVIIVLDEFEKVFNPRNVSSSTQEGFLPLLDGMFSSKKLFILGANDRWSINDFMINRPGRIYYHFKYSGLDKDFIREYAEDTLKSDYLWMIEDILKVSAAVKAFNFDMMKAMVEEINRYGETPKEVINYLNIEPASNGDRYKIVKIIKNGKLITAHDHHLWGGSGGTIFNPKHSIWFHYALNNEKDEDDWLYFQFMSADLKAVEDGIYIFEKDDIKLEVTLDADKQFNFSDIL